ncbi:MAG: hypothetical protein FJ029_03405 [Actinobacteria bacterium]|nr:hypothetical protein [Actinomycetota bacterium]
MQASADWILKNKVAYPSEMAKTLSADIGDPFSNGKVLFWPANGPFGTQAGRIKDRFKWGLTQLPEGPDGKPVVQQFSDQPHMVTKTAELRGSVEAVVDLLLFMFGKEVQGRIAIDRGSVVERKDVAASPELAAAPPENHGVFKSYLGVASATQPQFLHPAWFEWYSTMGLGGTSEVLLGKVTVEQGIADMKAKGDKVLAANMDRYKELKAFTAALKQKPV